MTMMVTLIPQSLYPSETSPQYQGCAVEVRVGKNVLTPIPTFIQNLTLF
jgi:hypothetical protein